MHTPDEVLGMNSEKNDENFKCHLKNGADVCRENASILEFSLHVMRNKIIQ